MAATAGALAALLLARPGPAATGGGCPSGAATVAPGKPLALSGTAPQNFDICLAGNLKGALLDVRVAPTGPTAKTDSVQLELDTAGGSYLRSSRVQKPGAAQRVGLDNPDSSPPAYQVSVAPGGPALGLVSSPVAFRGSVTLGPISAKPSPMFSAPVTLPKSGDGEPSVVVDRRNSDRVFVTAPVGIPSAFNPIATGNGSGGIDYWRANDKGVFEYSNISLGDGGGDSHIAVDGAGGVYFADLAAADVNLLKSTDEGKTVTQLLPTGNTTADREWLAPYLPHPADGANATTLHLAYHDFFTQELWECNGSGGGTVTEACGPIVPQNHPDIFASAVSNTIIGPQVLGPTDGTIYVPFGISTPQENVATGGSGAIDHIYVGVSKDGSSWNAYPVATPKSLAMGASAANIFPVAAVDSAGTVYVAWSQQNLGPAGAPAGPIILELSHSSDGGKSWSAPAAVNAPGVNSAVLPWIAARGPGQVDLVYVGSSTRDNPDDALATWYGYLAESRNGASAKPSFTSSVMVASPVRYGQVCVSGIACAGQGDDGRSLLDFISVDLDTRGCAVAAVPSTTNQATYPSNANMVTQTLVARQTSGCLGDPVRLSAAARKAPASKRARRHH